MRAAARLLAVLILAAAFSAIAQEKHLIDPTPPRLAQSRASAAAAKSGRAVDAGQGTVRAQIDAVSWAAALDRRLFRRLPRRRYATAGYWTHLASHAAVAQPQLGQSATRSLHRTVCQQREKDWLEWSFGWRHVAAARRADALRRSEEHTSELQSQSNLVCRL